MRILVLVTDFSGHHLHFASLLCEAVREAGLTPVLSGPTGFRQSPEFAAHVSKRVAELEVREFPGSQYRTRSPWLVRRLFWDETRAVRADWAFVPFADVLAASSLLHGPVCRILPVSGLVLRGGFAYGADSFKKWLKYLATRMAQSGRPLTRMWHLDPLAFECLRSSGASIGLMPEPVEPVVNNSREEARVALGLPRDCEIVALMGHLDARKGVLELLEAHRQARVRDRLLLLLGKLDLSLRSEVHARATGDSSVIIRDGYLDAQTFAQAFVASDWQAVTYPRHIGSSGILVRAAAYRRPVIASSWGWVGEATRRFGLGVTCDCRSSSALAETLRNLPAGREQGDQPASAWFRSFNTEANFRAHWIDSLGISSLTKASGSSTQVATGAFDRVDRGSDPRRSACD
jgi:hypothetical protein